MSVYSRSQSGCRRAVLYAPAHFFLDGKKGGSELFWAYSIVDGLPPLFQYKSDAITGYVIGDLSSSHVNIYRTRSDERFSLSIFYSLSFMVRYFFRARRLLKECQYDVVHHVLPFKIDVSFNPLVLFRLLRGTPFILGPLQTELTYETSDEMGVSARNFESRGSRTLFWVNRLGPHLFSWPLRALSRATIRRADAVVVVNEATRRRLAESVPTARVIVISPGVDLQKYQYMAFADKDYSAFRIVFVGNLIRRKGVDVLLRGAAKVIRQFPHVYIDIVGSGPLASELSQLAQDLGIANNVVFHGYVENAHIAEYYQRAHMFAMLSRSDSFGQVFIEAMACGLPVLASRTHGSEGIVIDNSERGSDSTGFLVQQEDVRAVHDVLTSVLEDTVSGGILLEQMSERAGRRAREEYSLEKMVERYAALYDSVHHMEMRKVKVSS